MNRFKEYHTNYMLIINTTRIQNNEPLKVRDFFK